MLTCIILCKGFSRGSRLMQRSPGFPTLRCAGLCKDPQASRLQGVPAYAKFPRLPGSRAHRLFQTPSSGAYSLQRLSAILASKDFFTVMASSGHIS